MKQKWMLLLLLMLMGGMAKAEWTQPDPLQYKVTEIVPSENENGTIYYLYEAGLETFFSQGNQWSAEASLDNANPKKFFFSKYMADGVTWDGISYRMNNWVTNKSIWDHMFITTSDGITYIVSDCTMGAGGACRGDDFWCFDWADDGTMKIYVSDHSTARGETALGYKAYMATTDFPTNTRIGLNIPESSNLEFTEVLNWTVVDAAAYDAAHAVYAKAEELINAIRAAEEENPGIDLSSVQAVYDNTSSTVEEMQAAIDAIPGLVRDFVLSQSGGATLDNPIEMTQLIATPDYGVGNASGWEGDVADIVDGCAQLWNKVDSFNFHQDIKNLPNGVYRINVQGMYRVGNPDGPLYAGGVCHNPALERAFIYGESNSALMRTRMMGALEGAETSRIHDTDYEFPNGLYVPNRQAGFTAWADLGYYTENETYVLVTDGTLRLGIYSDYVIESGSWCVFDNWTLEYCGTGSDAYSALTDQMVNFIEFDDTKVQAILRDEYETKIEALENATTPEEILAANEGLSALQDSISFNIMAFDEYLAAMAEIQTYLEEHDDFAGPARDFLEEYFTSDAEPGDYPNGGYIYITEDTPLNSAQLKEEILYVQHLLQTAIQTSITEGTDITNLLANTNMAQPNYQGWTSSVAITDNYDSGMGLAEYPVAQAFRTPFDLNQTLENMPDGVYELNVNALFRWGGEWASQDEKVVPIVLYLNEFSTPIRNITGDMISADDAVDMENSYITTPNTWPYDNTAERDGKTYYAPNSVTGCSYAFRAGRYKQTVYGLVTDGKLTLGMRDDRTSSMEWSVFSNFRLTYQGKNTVAMTAVLADLQQKADAYQAAAAIEGITLYQGYFNNIQTFADEFNAATDESTKYNELIAINEELKRINTNAILYQELAAKLDLAYGAYWDLLDSIYTQEDVTAFEQNIYYPLTEAMQNGTLSNEEAADKIEEVRTMEAIDLVYVFGDLANQAWGSETSINPLIRQADGTYQGVFETVNRIGADGYGNRSGVYFSYQGELLSSSDPHKRDVTGKTQTFALSAGSDRWLATYGGKWKATVSADRKTVTMEPVGEPLYPDNMYVVGDLAQGYWNHNQSVALSHMGGGLYTGLVSIGDTDGRFTVFGGGWSISNINWTEARLGTGEGNVDLPLNETVHGVARFYGECAWRLPAGTYVLTLNYADQTIRVSPLEIAGEGTTEKPYLITSLSDLDALTALAKPGQTNYVRLETDLDMAEVENWAPLFNISKNAAVCNMKIDFDGQQHIIRNFHGNAPFFGTFCGEIRNLGFENADVTDAAGILTASAGHKGYFTAQGHRDTTVIENVWVSGSLSSGADCAGALAGYIAAPTVIRNCYTNVTITGEASYMGGLVGQVNDRLEINNAYAAGSTARGGGIIGGGQDETTPAAAYDNIVVWNNTDQNFGPLAAASELNVPVADVLDVVFKEDGSAEDVSPMKNAVETVGTPTVSMNETYGRNSTHVTCTYGDVPESYYRVNYAGNQAFIDALSDGHSLETVFAVAFDRMVDKEIKPFSATQSGGMGFLVGKTNHNYHISYIAHVGGGYKWAESTIVPQSTKYYHLVASWDKEKGTLSLYINGVKHAEVAAEGDLTLPEEISQWFCIGADPGTDAAQSGANFEVVTARIYNQPLTEKNAYDLYNRAMGMESYAGDSQSNISYYDGSNWSNLQQTVVAWDNTLWTCDMQEGNYPVFAWDTTGGTSIESVTGGFKADGEVQIFSLNGQMLYKGALKNAKLNKGVYIISTKGKSYKVSLP